MPSPISSAFQQRNTIDRVGRRKIVRRHLGIQSSFQYSDTSSETVSNEIYFMSFCKQGKAKPWVPSDDESEPHSEPVFEAPTTPSSEETIFSRSYSLPPKAIKQRDKLKSFPSRFLRGTLKQTQKDIDRTFSANEIKEYFLKDGTQWNYDKEGVLRRDDYSRASKMRNSGTNQSTQNPKFYSTFENSALNANRSDLRSFTVDPAYKFAPNSRLVARKLLSFPRKHSLDQENDEYFYGCDDITHDDDLSLFDNEESVDWDFDRYDGEIKKESKPVTSNMSCREQVLEKMKNKRYESFNSGNVNTYQHKSKIVNESIKKCSSDMPYNPGVLKKLGNIINEAFVSGNLKTFDFSELGEEKQNRLMKYDNHRASLPDFNFDFEKNNCLKDNSYEHDLGALKSPSEEEEVVFKESNENNSKSDYLWFIKDGRVQILPSKKPVPPMRSSSIGALDSAKSFNDKPDISIPNKSNGITKSKSMNTLPNDLSYENYNNDVLIDNSSHPRLQARTMFISRNCPDRFSIMKSSLERNKRKNKAFNDIEDTYLSQNISKDGKEPTYSKCPEDILKQNLIDELIETIKSDKETSLNTKINSMPTSFDINSLIKDLLLFKGR